MPIETVDSNAWGRLDSARDVIDAERTRRLQALMPGESISFVDAPAPAPTPMRQAQAAGNSAAETQAQTQTQAQSQATTTLQPAQAQQLATAMQAQANALIAMSLTPFGGAALGGAMALLAASDAVAAAASAAAAAVNAATTPPAPTASADKIALYELLLNDNLLKEVVTAYCPEVPTSLPSNETTDSLVLQYGKDLTCRLLQASTAITRAFDDYRDAMDKAAKGGPDGGGSGWVYIAGTPGSGDQDGTADKWEFDTVRFTADYAKGSSVAARAFAAAHGKDGSFAKITQVLSGNTDAGEIYNTNTGGIDPDSAQFKREDINDGGSVVRWESARMGRNALVQIDLNDPLEMYDPKAVWFDPDLGFVTANANIVPEDSTLENVVILVVVAVATWGIGTAICTAADVAVVGAAGGAIMGATGAIIGGLWQNGTVTFEDVVRGAVTGAIMGAVSEYLDVKGVDPKTGAVTDWGARLTAIGAKAGIQGMLAEITGGEFKDAFGAGFAGGIAAEVGRSINLSINKALDAGGLTAEQASAYRTLGRATTTAIAALGNPDDPLAKFATDFFGDALKAEIKVPANVAGGWTSVATSQDNTTQAEGNATTTQTESNVASAQAESNVASAQAEDNSTTAQGNGQQTVLTDREQQGIEQSDDILGNRFDELAAANGLNPIKLADGSLQYPDGRIATPRVEVITHPAQADTSTSSGNTAATSNSGNQTESSQSGAKSVYGDPYVPVRGYIGAQPVGGEKNLTLARDLPPLPTELTPNFINGPAGSGIPYRDQAGQVWYRTFDSTGAEKGWVTVAAESSSQSLANAAAPLILAGLTAETRSGNVPLMIVAGGTLAGVELAISLRDNGVFRTALDPEQVRNDQQPLINVPVSPGPAGTPGQIADNRDTSIPGYQSPDSQSTSTTTLPVSEPAWADPVVDARMHDNAHGFSTRDINPHDPTAGGDLNCIKCALALDATLGGSPTQALPGIASNTFDGGRKILEDTYGTKLIKIDSPEAIAQVVSGTGPAARGIVIGYQSGESYSHAFNVVNQNGVIRFLDGQIGEGAKDVGRYDHYWLIITTDGK
jgi:hypothetical protein